MKALTIGAIGLVAGASIAGTVAWVVWPARSPTVTRLASPRSDLSPNLDAIRYRFAITASADPRLELDSTIKAFEARVKVPAPQPHDLGELADLYYRRGQQAGDARDYKAAEDAAKRSLELLMTPNSAVLTLAKLANARHDFREAIRIASEYRGSGTGAPIILATAHLAVGELDRAAAAANTAVAIKPDTSTYSTRALVMQAQGRDREAAADFAAAVRAEDHGDVQGSARMRAMWGRFLLRRGELAGAEQLFAEALRIAPDFALAQAFRAELLLRSGKVKEATAQFEAAFAGSRQVRYLMDQARAQELAGDRAGADVLRAQVETIVRGELGEGGLGHRLDLVEVLVDRGGSTRLTAAITLGREEVTKRPSTEVRYQLARALASAGSIEEAAREVQAALATGARDAQLYELASRIEKRRKNPTRATMYLRMAEELDPGASGWRQLGMP